ncbi:hypothetical protein ERO13_A10G173300v2 [Gossypium hirsutum]|nr:hypothetical protein ERO13_A10G173300v2 [Gossypium hirsutum]
METCCFLTLNLPPKGYGGAGMVLAEAWGGRAAWGDQGFSFFAVFFIIGLGVELVVWADVIWVWVFWFWAGHNWACTNII